MSRRKCCCNNCTVFSDSMGGSSYSANWTVVSGSWTEGSGYLSTSSTSAAIKLNRTLPVDTYATGWDYVINVAVDLENGVDYRIFIGGTTTYLEITCTVIGGVFRTGFQWMINGTPSYDIYYQDGLPTGFFNVAIYSQSGVAYELSVGNYVIGSIVDSSGNSAGNYLALGTGPGATAASKFKNLNVEYSYFYQASCPSPPVSGCCSALQITFNANLNQSGTGCSCGGWIGTWELALATAPQLAALVAAYPTTWGIAIQNGQSVGSCFYILESGLPCGCLCMLASCYANDTNGAQIGVMFIQGANCGANIGWGSSYGFNCLPYYCGQDFTNSLLVLEAGFIAAGLTLQVAGGDSGYGTYSPCDFALPATAANMVCTMLA